MAVIMKMNFFDVVPCSPDDVNQRFEGISRTEYSESKNKPRKLTTFTTNRRRNSTAVYGFTSHKLIPFTMDDRQLIQIFLYMFTDHI
jgi:hypothetical protein